MLPITSKNKNAPIVDTNRQSILGFNDLVSDAWGRQKIVQDFSVMHGMATFDISPKIWFVDENGVELTSSDLSTRVTAKKGGFNIDSGANLNDSSTLRGKRHPRYQPNRGWLFSTAGVLPNINANASRLFGGFTEESGFFFELTQGTLYAVVRQANWQYFTATAGQTVFTSTECDILPTSKVIVRTKLSTEVRWTLNTAYTINTTTNTVTFTIGRTVGEQVIIIVVDDKKQDITNVLQDKKINLEKENVYDIQSQWRGAGDVFFYINLELVYIYQNLGINTQPSISNPALPINFTCTNLGDSTSMLIGCADVTSEGGNLDRLDYIAVVNKPQLQIPVTDVTLPDKVLMVVYSPNSYKGRHNTRDFQILRVTASTDANAFLNIYVSRNPVWTAGSILLKARTDGSSLLYDNALDATNTAVRGLTFNPASGSLITSVRIPANGSNSIDNPNQYKLDYTLTHGDYLIVTGLYEKNGTANMLAIIELGEEM